MVNCIDSALKVIATFSEIEIINHDEGSIVLEIAGTQFCLWMSGCEDSSKMPFVTVVNNNEKFPHFMVRETEFGGKKHRAVCLYEAGSMVFSLFSLEEKIEFIIKQLLKLLFLPQTIIEQEFQKEFLYYWNSVATNNYRIDLFLKSSDKFQWLDIYQKDRSKTKRIISSEAITNDNDKFKYKEKTAALHIPIEDIRGIIPPTKNKMWTIHDVLNILDNKEYARISFEAYTELFHKSYSFKSIVLIFEMKPNGIAFCCELNFKNPGTAKLINKIKHQVESINSLRVKRCDFSYLNAQIGNDLNLIGKNVAVIGVGSLGSYIAKEIVKIGIKDITLIDDDVMNYENLMRHQLSFGFSNVSKVQSMKFELEWIHPEIQVEAINKKVSTNNLNEIVTEIFDLVIFAVGSSDVQLECNKALKKLHYKRPVLFCWLEGNGQNSHVLGIDYSKNGCYQCLFTDGIGKMVNNKANTTSGIDYENYILRNGCGGTRMAYGNGILLQTTSMIVMAIKKVLSGEFNENFLIDNIENTITIKNNWFYERNCQICNEN